MLHFNQMFCLIFSGKDHASIKNDGTSLIAYLPLSAIDLKEPQDGLPCIGDFITTTISYIFNGSRLHREPLDVYLMPSNDGSAPPRFGLKKGFTRLKLVPFQ